MKKWEREVQQKVRKEMSVKKETNEKQRRSNGGNTGTEVSLAEYRQRDESIIWSEH